MSDDTNDEPVFGKDGQLPDIFSDNDEVTDDGVGGEDEEDMEEDDDEMDEDDDEEM